jgi:hypothetical protein
MSGVACSASSVMKPPLGLYEMGTGLLNTPAANVTSDGLLLYDVTSRSKAPQAPLTL